MAKIALNNGRFNPEDIYVSTRAQNMSKKNSFDDASHHTVKTKKATSRFLTKEDLKKPAKFEGFDDM